MTELFDAGGGIRLDDPSAMEGSIDAFDPTNGRNVIVVTFDLQAMTAVTPNQTITNTATLFNYAGLEGGVDHTTSDRTDSASITARNPNLGKTLTGTEFVVAGNSNTQAVVGELVTYQLVLTIPEGTLPNAVVIDTLDAGLAFVQLTGISRSSANITTTVGAGDFSVAASFSPTVTGSGSIATFNLGTITNSNTDNAVSETITLTYTAVVLNTAGNQASTALNNSAQFTWTGNSLAPASAANITVVEPAVDVAKSVVVAGAGTQGDAADPVVYTLTLSHTAGPTAFETTLSDFIPSQIAGATIASVVDSAGLLTAASFEIVAGELRFVGGGSTDMTVGRTVTITVNGTLATSVQPGQIINNVANIQWSSLDGTVIDRSSFNTASDERSGEGGLNDYNDTASAAIQITTPIPTKSIVATSESHTTNVAGIERLVVGEIVRYRLTTQLGEGTALNTMFFDRLPAGLTFLDDGTATVAFVSNGTGITSSGALGIAGAGLNISGNASNVTPVYVLSDANVSASSASDVDTYTSGTDVYFKFGNLLNSDSDADAEFVVVEFNALVNNVIGNQSDTLLSNDFQLVVNSSTIATATAVAARVAEPVITGLTKTIVTSPADGGDTIVYTLSYANTAVGANAAAAFDIRTIDAINANLTLQSVVVSVPVGSSFVDNSIGNNVDVMVDRLDPSGTVTITITATVNSTAQAGQIIPNTASLTFTSLPGGGTTGNPTGSVTPGPDGGVNGERNGSGGVNDYADTSNTVSSTLAAPTIDKLSLAPNNSFAIGELVSYTIRVTMTEGMTVAASVLDNLPLGLAYESFSIITSAAASSGLLLADFNGSFSAIPSASSFGGSGDDVTVSFGDITTASDNVAGNNQFLVVLNTRMLNVIGNQNTVTLTNNVAITYTNPNTGTSTSVADPTPVGVTVKEPILAVDKVITSLPTTNLDAGDSITYQITINHTTASTANAYDALLTDAIPSGLLITSIDSVVGVAATTFAITGGGTGLGTVAGGFDLALGQTIVITYTATLRSDVTPGQTLTNDADLTWTSMDGANAGERDGSGGVNDYTATDNATTSVISTLAIDKTIPSGDTTYSIGEVITYQILVTVMEGTTNSVLVTDVLPDDIDFVVGSMVITPNAKGMTYSDGTVKLDGTTLSVNLGTVVNPGDNGKENNTLTLTYQAVVRNNSLNNIGEVKSNTATVSATDLPNAVDTQNVTIVEPVLAVDKTVNDTTPHLGDTLTFQVTLQHDASSTTDAMDVRLMDALPEGLTLVPGSIVVVGGGAYTNATSGNTLDLQWNQVNLTDVITVTYQATVTSDITQFATSRTNTAQVAYDTQPGSNPEERTYSVLDNQATTIVGPDISVVKNDGQQIRTPGEIYTYSLTVTNSKDLIVGDVGTNVVVVDTLPVGVDFVSAGGPYFQSWNPITREVRWLIPTLGVGNSELLTIDVQVNDPLASGIDLIKSSVVVTHDDIDPTPSNNLDSDTDHIEAAPDLYVTKDDGIIIGHAGETITYTIVVGNCGNQNAVNVNVLDRLPTNVLDFVSADHGGVFDPLTGQISWSFAEMVGYSTPLVLTVVAKVKAFTPAGVTEFTNVVTIGDGGANGLDPTPGNNSAQDRNDLFARPDLVVGVTDSLERISPNDIVTYVITVSNVGTQEATQVLITSTLPQGVAFVSASDGGVYDPVTHVVTWSGASVVGRDTITRTITVLGTLDLKPLEDVVNMVTVQDDGANGPDPTPENNVATDIDEAFVYVFDSFNDPLINFPTGFGDSSASSSGSALSLGSPKSGLSFENINNPRFQLKTLPVDPMFSGTVDPGTTLVGKIYDASGRVMGERTVVADAGGNWVMTFPTAVIHKHPHRMTMEQTPSATINPPEGFNMRRYFHPAIHGSLFMSEQLTISNVFRNQPHTVLQSMHQANLNPLDLRGEHLRSYESHSSSSSPGQG